MKKIQQFNLISSIKEYFRITPYKDIISWLERKHQPN